ncbi:diguanylate phosphodiesterase [Novimethylophilus kurashikiensis]|uniref:Diguanylate phosphodiesterase n=1 Tax=Novimethylophilus kurashikiensis TaxID=1825523 RepID=A0A2R5F598_9PROT|nr:EAL domain-containing protein [Novimethylophilus kurashikiensis]GBG13345.1 diguanylate phosphodiesterase [Novimethylophilus kurashikiensis]
MLTTTQELPGIGYLRASLDEIQRAMTLSGDRAVGQFKDARISSVFQPIYSISHRRIVGHEGLMRATVNDKAVPPLNLLGNVAETESVFLDRLCRALHVHNYQMGEEDRWLFLNVSADVINRRRDHEPFFSELLHRYNIEPRRIVVEIVEGFIPDFRLLTEAVEFYRNAGCVVAIDDFGAEASDIERIWRASPDIVKLDRKLIAAAEFNIKARRILQATVALIHESGSLALLEGVENEAQANIALDSGADMVQGFFFARPADVPLLAGDGGIRELSERYASAEGLRHRSLQPYILKFKAALARLSSGETLESACGELSLMPKSEQCYVIDSNGDQHAPGLRGPRDARTARFAPLEQTVATNWAHKPYHYRATMHPNEVQISRPYLSITSARLCVTLSCTFRLGEQTQVLCCDIDWNEEDGHP